eukprot:GDKK01064710.1.p1 GENE.GDKK01064710.1~~GDKK01064710.1.p1  ORF type:complete len:182 (-),score=14.06 GDKK01064710.1:352-870(-)
MYDSDEVEDEAEEDYCMSYVKIHSSDKHEESMLKVLETLCLPWDESRVFTRCVDCNVLIESVPEKEKVRGLVPVGVFDIYGHFYNCPKCLKVYWGVDNGVAVNYKSVRTIEYLRQFRGVFANGGKARSRQPQQPVLQLPMPRNQWRRTAMNLARHRWQLPPRGQLVPWPAVK